MTSSARAIYRCVACGRQQPGETSCGLCGASMPTRPILSLAPPPARERRASAAAAPLPRSGGVEPPVLPLVGELLPPLIASEGLSRSTDASRPASPSPVSLEVLEAPSPAPATRSLSSVARDVVVRVPCNWGGLDHAFGGGPGRRHVALLGGRRGSGKTRLAVPMVAGLANATGRCALYCSAEGQDAGELAAMLPADVDGSGIEVLESDELGELEAMIELLDPIAVVVDSMQSLRVTGTRLGSDDHARALLTALRRHARTGEGRCVFALSQMNGEGRLRGSEIYQQLCETVALLERDEQGRRVFRFDAKNRGGPDDRTALFRFDDAGILRGVAADPNGAAT